MQVQRSIIFFSVVMLIAFVSFGVVTPAAYAVGTQSNTTIENAISTGDTFPSGAGELSVRFTNSAGGDTQFTDTGTSVTTLTDTGYDLNDVSLAGNRDPDGGQSISAGDSIVYAFTVTNEGNNSDSLAFNAHHIITSPGSGASNDTFIVELFWEPNAQSASGFDTNTANRLTTTDDTVNFAADQTKTFFAVVTAKSSGEDGESVDHEFFVTDNAPIESDNTTGDGWQDGGPISGDDTEDTFTFGYTTTITGPVLNVSKTLVSLAPDGQFRPGDTVEYTITLTNNGGDTATNVELVDAVPSNTTYVDGSADASNTPNGNTINLATFDSTLNAADDFGDGESTFESNGDAGEGRIKWPIDTIGPTGQSNDSVQITFQVTID